MSKILYAASTARHLRSFHLPYIEALRAEGHEVKTLGRGEGVDYDIPFEKKLLSTRNTACRRELRRILQQEQFDCLLLNTTLCALHVRLACPRRGRPRVVNFVHGYLFSDGDRSLGARGKRLVERLLRGRTDALLVMNGEDLRIAERDRLAPEIYFTRGMGVSDKPERTAPQDIRRRYGEGRYAIAYLAELSPRKNQRLLIEAVALLRERVPNLCLWLVGDGAERPHLERKARALGIADRVVFFGQRADACDILRAADLYVSTARSEGLPFNVAEALAAGKPIVASRVKGNAELITDGQTGLLFHRDSLTELTDAILAVYDGRFHPDEAAMRRTYDTYSLPAVLPDTLRLMRQAMRLPKTTEATEDACPQSPV